MNDGMIQARRPLQLRVVNASQMILPPVASQLVSTAVAAWLAGTAHVYGDIVRNGKYYYWCVTLAGGNAGANPPVHRDGDVTDGALVWRFIHWSRSVVSLTSVDAAGVISISRGFPAVALSGLVLYPHGSHSEGYEDLGAFEGAWYAVSDIAAPGRALAISEG